MLKYLLLLNNNSWTEVSVSFGELKSVLIEQAPNCEFTCVSGYCYVFVTIRILTFFY